MDTAMYITAFVLFGLLAVWALMLTLWCGTWLVGKLLWRRLMRIYHFTVILYWLDRLEKGGWRVFQKAEQEDKETGATP